MRAHGLNVDDLADDRELLKVLVRSALDGQLHARFGRTAHAVDSFFQGEALDRSVVDARDQIAGHQPGARRRRIVDRAHDLDQAVLHHDFEAEAAEFLALHAGLEVLQRLGIKIVRMRIERRQHAVDRRFDHLLVVGLLDIAVADLVENLGEDRQPVVGADPCGVQRPLRNAGQRRAGHDSIRKVGESSLHRMTLGSAPWVRLHQFGLAAPGWPGSDGAADAAGAAGASVFAGAASALTAGSGCFTPCNRSIAACNCLSSFSSGGT